MLYYLYYAFCYDDPAKPLREFEIVSGDEKGLRTIAAALINLTDVRTVHINKGPISRGIQAAEPEGR